MIVHCSGNNGLALYIDAEEMAARGLNEMGEDAARAFAEDALNNLGLAASLSEIEAFSGAGGTMIFASLRSRRHSAAFEFPSLDALLDSAASASFLDSRSSSLHLLDGKYIITLFDATDALALHMSEYARRLPDTESREIFLREHGALLEPENALARLAGGI